MGEEDNRSLSIQQMQEKLMNAGRQWWRRKTSALDSSAAMENFEDMTPTLVADQRSPNSGAAAVAAPMRMATPSQALRFVDERLVVWEHEIAILRRDVASILNAVLHQEAALMEQVAPPAYAQPVPAAPTAPPSVVLQELYGSPTSVPPMFYGPPPQDEFRNGNSGPPQKSRRVSLSDTNPAATAAARLPPLPGLPAVSDDAEYGPAMRRRRTTARAKETQARKSKAIMEESKILAHIHSQHQHEFVTSSSSPPTSAEEETDAHSELVERVANSAAEDPVIKELPAVTPSSSEEFVF